MPRICRVAPDVTAVERVFDYLVPDTLASLIRVGTIVRVPLHGRRVRGWVVADGVDSETTEDRLRETCNQVFAGVGETLRRRMVDLFEPPAAKPSPESK